MMNNITTTKSLYLPTDQLLLNELQRLILLPDKYNDIKKQLIRSVYNRLEELNVKIPTKLTNFGRQLLLIP